VKETILGDSIIFLYSPYLIESMMRAKTRWPARKSHLALEYWRVVETPECHENGGILST